MCPILILSPPFFFSPGKIWLTLVILLRLVIIFFAAYPLYQDEQERFVCNTMQPGCSNACYDFFAPVSLFRFWLIQTLSVLLPYVVFGVCVMHSVARQVVKAYFSPYHRYKEIKALAGHKVTKKSSRGARSRLSCGANGMDIPYFSKAYTIQLVFRMLLEAGFVAVHYYLIGFSVPRHFPCNKFPCPGAVDCYVSRPTEKCIMMIFIGGFSSFSVLLSLVDLIFAIRTNTVRNNRDKLLLERLKEEEEKRGGSPYQCNQPTHDLVGHGKVCQDSMANTDHSGDAACCLLGYEMKDGSSFQSELTPQQTNFNRNSNKSCIAATNQDSKGVQKNEEPDASHTPSGYDQQPGTLKTLERKLSDDRSVCSSARHSISKKSEWV